MEETGAPRDETTPNPLVEWSDLCSNFGQEVFSEVRPDLIVSSLFCMGLADELAKANGVPWCFVNPSFYFGDFSTREWDEDWYGDRIVWFARDCLLPLARLADIVLHATDPVFDFQPTQLPQNHHYVGFMLWEPSNGMPGYLDEPGDPWALVTVSTVPQVDEIAIAQSALSALADRSVRTLVTVPDTDARHDLGQLPANATLGGFVPHTPVLKRSSIVVSHAGHGLVSKALYYGVPMVLVPWDRDQPGVADRALDMGIARVIRRDEVSLSTVREAVEDVLDNPRYAQIAKEASERLKATDSVDVACQLLNEL
jgi:UDP:flavonoid glycosyltransferase YjiC (YdhE family)